MRFPGLYRGAPGLVFFVTVVFSLATPAFAGYRIVYTDRLVSAMAQSGHPVAKYHGSYATQEACNAAIRQAVAESGDPNLINHMSCEPDGKTSGSSSGGFAPMMPFPSTEEQAMVNVVDMMFKGLMSGQSANNQAAQQQALLLKQKQAEEEKKKAELLDKQRAEAAGAARSVWDSHDASIEKTLGEMFGPPSGKDSGLSPLLQKHAALQLQGVAGPVDETSLETIRRSAGVGFDEAAKTPSGNLAVFVPEPPDPIPVQTIDPVVVMAQIEESKTRLFQLDKDLEKAREKHKQAKMRLEKARQDQVERKAKVENPKEDGGDAALLAELEAEEAQIDILAREMDESAAKLNVLDEERKREAKSLDELKSRVPANNDGGAEANS